MGTAVPVRALLLHTHVEWTVDSRRSKVWAAKHEKSCSRIRGAGDLFLENRSLFAGEERKGAKRSYMATYGSEP